LVLGASLLGDLEDDHIVRALQAEPCILGDYSAGLVIIDHLIGIPIGRGEYV
jgi:hypothetical protein